MFHGTISLKRTETKKVFNSNDKRQLPPIIAGQLRRNFFKSIRISHILVHRTRILFVVLYLIAFCVCVSVSECVRVKIKFNLTFSFKRRCNTRSHTQAKLECHCSSYEIREKITHEPKLVVGSNQFCWCMRACNSVNVVDELTMIVLRIHTCTRSTQQ